MFTNFPLQFNYIPYPLWRRTLPVWLKPLALSIYRRMYPVNTDLQPPTLETMSGYLRRWQLLTDATPHLLELAHPQLETPAAPTASTLETPIRIPAQWETLEGVILNWCVLYPPLWALYREMAMGIASAADVVITVPSEAWAYGIAAYLRQTTAIDMERVRFSVVPADDIWVRDYGPFVGVKEDGRRGIVGAIYDTHWQYPQAQDDAMALDFAAHYGIPARKIALRTEGGNFLTDGAGTLIMSHKVFDANPHLDKPALEALLHQYFDFEKVIITPRLGRETTGHVDLLVKLITPQTILISGPNELSSRRALQATVDLFQNETNARGQRYTVKLLPTLPLYYNWFFYPIRRSYTNALTVNGRILVPVYGVPEDEQALAVYREVAPDYEIIPIDCKIGANGGGAVHCMTKEIPAG